MNIIHFLFEVYTRFICFCLQIHKAYLQNRLPFFHIDSVLYKDDDITSYYMYNRSFDLSKYSKSILSWSVHGVQYKFLLSQDSADNFPPYSYHEMRHCTPENKIVTAFIQDSDGNIVDNVGKLIKQMAGPKQNFYKDLGLQLKTGDMWCIGDKTLSIVTSKCTKTYDLSKDNILEL